MPIETRSNDLYEINGLSYLYLDRFKALDEICLTVKSASKTALLGANGSGKSTLLLLLSGLIFPQRGMIRFMGKDLTEEGLQDPSFRKFFRSRVGIVFQNSDVQLFNSSVEDEMLFGLTQLGLPEEEVDKRLERYMDLMDIGRLRDRHPQYLSIGEKKRVAIASVLAMEPEVILLDEPTAGLDPRTTRHLIDAAASFSEEGRTIITATQDIHIVPEMADRVIVLGEDKRIAKDGRAEDVLGDNAFLEEHNLVHTHAHKHKGRIHVHPHDHPAHEHPH